MESKPCTQIQRWLREQGAKLGAMPIAESFVEHIAGCARCRGVLVLLMADLVAAPLSMTAVSCADCQRDLAMYIDIECEQGATAAIQALPEVWWHFWTCRSCVEVYEDTRRLLEVADQGAFVAAFQQQSRQPARQPLYLVVPKSCIIHAQKLRQAQGVVRGAIVEPEVVYEEEIAGCFLSFGVQPETTDLWSVVVASEPPLVGRVALVLDTLTTQAVFDSAGRAVFSAVPAGLFLARTAGDITIAIEPSEDVSA